MDESFGFHEATQSIGVRVTATGEMPEAGRNPVGETRCGSHASLLLLRSSFAREAL